MLSLAESPRDVVLLDENSKPLLAGDNGRRFFEGSWRQQYNGTRTTSRILIPATRTSSCDARGKSPDGPVTVRGKILEPVLGWTNHHPIVEFQAYLFYHDGQLSKGETHLRNKVTEPSYGPTTDRDGRRLPRMRSYPDPAAPPRACRFERLRHQVLDRPPRDLLMWRVPVPVKWDASRSGWP